MVRSLLSFCLSLLKSHTQLHLEILFLRKQLETVTRSSPKLRVRPSDRLLIGMLTGLYDSWKEALLIVKPETVIRWHKEGFRLYWRWESRSEPGRPKIPRAQINLIKQMANENPLRGAPRIHGELLKLGFDISEATVLRYMPRNPGEQQASSGKHSSGITALKSSPSISLRCRRSRFDYCTYWSSFHTTEGRSSTSM